LFAGLFNLNALLLLAFAMGAVTSGHSPMRLALIPLLVQRDALPSAVGLSAMTFNVARIIGPALGAWLLSQWGAGSAFAVSVVMFAGSALVLLSLGGVGQRAPKPREPFLQQLTAGFHYASQHPGIRLLFALTFVNGLLARTTIELLPALSGALLGGKADDLAALTASAGVGSILGGLIVSRQSADLARLLTMVMGAIAGAALLMMSLHWMQDLWRLGVLVSLLALCATMAGTGCQTMTQLSLSEDFRGRVISLWTLLAMGAPALGSALFGHLSDQLGFVVVLACAAGIGLVTVIALYLRREALLGPA
jgi:predicted MFS family arabinose efflux permease